MDHKILKVWRCKVCKRDNIPLDMNYYCSGISGIYQDYFYFLKFKCSRCNSEYVKSVPDKFWLQVRNYLTRYFMLTRGL